MIGLGPLLAATLLQPAPWCERGAVDLHVDLPFQVHYRRQPADARALSLQRGCVKTVVLSLFVPHRMKHRDLDALLGVLDTAESIDVGEANVVFSVEGAAPLVGHLDAIEGLVARGVRIFGVVHSHHNAFAESSSDPHPHPEGLSDAGSEFVRAVYDAGALVDVSHASDASFDEIAAIAKARRRPLIATHSNARAVADHRRNLTDDQLRTIADSNGVVGVAFHAPFINRDWERANVRGLARHVAHMIEIMGPDHVALGSDLDGLIHPATGLASHAALPALAQTVLAEGVAPGAIPKLMAENARRVLVLPPQGLLLAP